MSTCWKVFCEEKEFPGLWPRWFKYQCVAVGWSEKKGFTLEGKAQDQSWAKARNALKRVKQGDLILAQLKDSRVARIGEVVRAEIRDDQWNPTVPPSKEKPGGGRDGASRCAGTLRSVPRTRIRWFCCQLHVVCPCIKCAPQSVSLIRRCLIPLWTR